MSSGQVRPRCTHNILYTRCVCVCTEASGSRDERAFPYVLALLSCVLLSSAPSAVNVSAETELRLGGKLFSHQTIISPGGTARDLQ